MSWVNKWIGKPYKANGRDENGYDCYGLVMAVYREKLGLKLPDWQSKDGTFLNQSREIKKRMLISLNNDFVELVKEPRDYDFVMAYRERFCGHIGVYYQGNVLHVSHLSCGATYERLKDFKNSYSKVRFLRWRQ